MWRYATANVTGSSHNKKQLPCQDRVACVSDETGLFLAMSDGAGSASHSAIGAEITVNVAIKVLKESLKSDIVTWSEKIIHAAKNARQAVLAEAADKELKSREFACTLLLIIATAQGGAALQIGDGVIVYKDDNDWAPIFWPQKGEFANTTFFLTDENAESHFEVTELPAHFSEIAMMTDGLERLALHFATQSVHAPFLEGLFKPLRSAKNIGEERQISDALADLLISPRIIEKTDDDLTICLATRA